MKDEGGSGTPAMQISIITPLFNRLDLTLACRESLERTLDGWDYEWILIDDGSTDGARGWLRSLPEGGCIRVVLNDGPRGFAANNNLGAGLARAPLLCLLNNDTVLLPGWLGPMARLARLLPDVALVGSVQREPFGGFVDHAGIFFDAEGMPQHACKDQPAPPREDYLEWPAVTAACCVVRRDLFLKLGGFDEAFRNGCEDVDFCLRAGERGYRHFVANRSVIYHHVSASPGRKRFEEENLRLFHARWLPALQTGLRAPRTRERQQAEARRYLRKHRWRPWRFNGWRVAQAVERLWRREPPGRELEWGARTWLAVEDSRFKSQASRKIQGERSKAEGEANGVEVYVVVDRTVRDAGRGGVATATRCLLAACGRLRARVRPVMWRGAAGSLCLLPETLAAGLDAEALRPAPGSARAALTDPGAGELDDPAADLPALHQPADGQAPPPGAWVLLPEVMDGEQAARLVEYVRGRGWRLAAVFHDAMPSNEPQFFAPGAGREHERYMQALARADLLLPVSRFSEEDFRRFAAARQLPLPPLRLCTLAADTCARARPAASRRAAASADAPLRMLCVSSVSPRKNHPALLAAFELAVAERPWLELTLLGRRQAGSEEATALIHETMNRHPGKVRWYESADYSLLRQLYEGCDFTVLPSLLEGFGLPIIESLWFGKPCLCANVGAMAETAAGGGCVTMDMSDPRAIAAILLALVNTPEHLEKLADEIDARSLETWEEYAGEVLERMKDEGG